MIRSSPNHMPNFQPRHHRSPAKHWRVRVFQTQAAKSRHNQRGTILQDTSNVAWLVQFYRNLLLHIQPHEDGPKYHPVVATISLGSHAIFNYFKYKEDHVSREDCDASTSTPQETLEVDKSNASSASTQPPTTARPIDPTPGLSLLLEPRSLIITRSALYTEHLHGIDPVLDDYLDPAEPRERDDEKVDSVENVDGVGESNGVRVANWSLLKSAEGKRVATQGGKLSRKTRVSLTCRSVEKIFGTKV